VTTPPLSILREVLRPGLRLVFCGSAPGKRSAELSEYYAGPGNRFWQTLAEVGLTPQQLSPSDYETLLTVGIGLTDLIVHQSGNDDVITFDPAARERLTATIMKHQPYYLCFNGKRAAKEFLAARSVAAGPAPSWRTARRSCCRPARCSCCPAASSGSCRRRHTGSLERRLRRTCRCARARRYG